MDDRFTREHPAYQTFITQMGQLDQQKRTLEKKLKNLPKTQQELLRLVCNMQVTTEIDTPLLNETWEPDTVRAGTVGNVRIIDSADAKIEKPVKLKNR